MCELIGMEARALPHRKKSSDTAYHEFYDSATEAKVREAYATDFETLGYPLSPIEL